ncbi:GntR family transcriptional regulator [Streptomyces sp. NPDC058861]|uniref:GntR family transcriptional regulator n=1 Tax=Streptomyces sp. NPDC058861 TaxID=3346653 RepID=UPI0036931528
MAARVVVVVVPAPALCCTRGTMYNQAYKGGRSVADGARTQPEYQRVYTDLRQKISSGALPVGEKIPSTDRLCAEYGVSKPVVRKAVEALQGQLILEGHPGKGVYVRARPADLEDEQTSLTELATGLKSVERRLEAMQAADNEAVAALRQEVGNLRRHVSRLDARLIELYGRLGQPYQREAVESDDSDGAEGGESRPLGA